MLVSDWKSNQLAVGRTILQFIALCGFSLPANVAYADDGIYFAIGLAHVAIGGDFDGSGGLDLAGVALLSPNVDDAVGTKFAIGLQGGPIIWEGSITMSDHDASYGALPTSTEYFSLNFDAKYLFNHRQPISLYGMVGIGLTTLTVSNGACDISGSFLINCNSDAQYSGIDLRFGGGVELQMANKLAVSFQLLQRLGEFGEAEGKGISATIDDSLDADGITLSAEIKYIFAQ